MKILLTSRTAFPLSTFVASYEHLYREEIADAVALGEEVEPFREIYKGIRPREALGFLTPMAVHLAEPNLFQPERVQES